MPSSPCWLKFWILLISFVIIISFFSGCFQESPAVPEEHAEYNFTNITVGQTIQVAIVAPWGDYIDAIGRSGKNGADLAFNDLNLNGIDRIYRNAGMRSGDSVEILTDLIMDGNVSAIIASVYSVDLLQVAPLADEKGVLIISPSATSPSLSKEGNFIFRTIPSDRILGKNAAEEMYDDGYRKAAVIYRSDFYGSQLSEVFIDRFRELGGEIVANEGIIPGVEDEVELVGRVLEKMPDAVYVISSSNSDSLLILDAFTQYTQYVAIYGSGSMDMSGCAYCQLLDVKVDIPNVLEEEEWFARHYMDVYGQPPGIYAAEAYDAAAALGYTIGTGARNGIEIREKLFDTGFDGATGHVSFDKNGDRIVPPKKEIPKIWE